MGYLFQNPDYEIFLPSVREELAWSLRVTAAAPHSRSRACSRMRPLFHLELDATPSTMSMVNENNCRRRSITCSTVLSIFLMN